ncbi:MAG: hypothetical protein ACE5EG_06715 [Thermoanaerobaculia bacterium]
MSGLAVLFMVLVGGFVWGGFVLLLVKAVRREAGKRSSGEAGPGGS